MHIPSKLKQLVAHLTKPNQTLSATQILHALVIKHGLSVDPFYPTKIVRLYAINADIVSANKVFVESPRRSVYLWNSIIRAYAQARRFDHAFALFARLLGSETRPDNYTFACITRACGESFDVEALQVVHGKVVAFGLGLDFICGSALVTCYSRSGLVDEARCVFDRIEAPDLVLWNAMISGYGTVGEWGKGMELLNAMRRMGVHLDGYTVVGLVMGMVHPSLMKLGEMVHGLCVKSGLVLNDHVGSVLVKMYSSGNNMDLAFRVFDSLIEPDLVSWSSLITGFCQAGNHAKAMILFRELVMNGGWADHVLLASLLAACGHLVSVRHGCEIHGYAVRHEYSMEVAVSSALVDMYAKCGFLEMAVKVFEDMPKRNIVSYNTVISSLGLYGHAAEAFRMFDEILEEGMKPDGSTFVGLLCACCHSRLVNEGRKYFEKMRSEFGIEAKTEHVVYMVKLLGMDGKLEEAYDLIKSMPEPVDSGIWGALLSCCESWKDYAMAEVIAKHLSGNDQWRSDCGYSVGLSNLFAGDGRWDVVKVLRGDYGGAKGKVPGISWIGEKRQSVE